MRGRALKAAAMAALIVVTSALSGCGEAGPEATEGAGAGYVYRAEFTALDGVEPGGGNAVMAGGRIWLPGRLVTGYEQLESRGESMGFSIRRTYSAPTYEPVLYELTAKGAVSRFTGFSPARPPEGMSGSGSICGICAGSDGGLVLLENSFASAETGEAGSASAGDLTPVYESRDVWLLHIYGPDGAERCRVDLGALPGTGQAGARSLACDGSGYIYVLDGAGRVLVLDRSGAYVSRSPEGGGFDFLSSLGGRVYGLDETDAGWELWAVDPVNGAVSRTGFTLPGAAARHFADSEYDLLYCEGRKLMGLDLGGRPQELLDLLDCGVSGSSLLGLFRLENGDLLCLLDEPGGAKLVRLVKAPADEAPAKKRLTLACAGLDYSLQNAIYQFNREHPGAAIEVIDYGSDADALTLLAADAGAGRLPDILCTAGLPLRGLIAKGYLLELTPLIEADMGFGALVEPLFEAMRVDGGLYEVTAGFSLGAVSAPAGLEGTKLDAAGLAELMAGLPEGLSLFERSLSPSGVFSLLFEPEEWIDWESGECRFDSAEFIALLEFAASYPQERADRADGHLLGSLSLGSMPESWLYEKAYFGGDMAVLDSPGGEGGVFGLCPLRLGISSSCEDTKLAWDFVRRLLEPDFQAGSVSGAYLPSSAAALESLLDGAVEEGESGRCTVAYGGTSLSFGRQDAEAVERLIASTRRIDGGYGLETLEDIVTEEVSRFFSGACSAEDCAALVQDRAGTYVNEQR